MEHFVLDTPAAAVRFLLVLVVATMAHEMGHLLMARLLRIPIRRISIGLGPVIWRRKLGLNREFVLCAFPVSMMIGVPSRLSTNPERHRPVTHDVFMAASGPAASLLLFVGLACVAGMGRFSPELHAWFSAVAIVSAFLGLSNLIPLPGLDGGHILVLGATALGLRVPQQRQIVLHRVGLRFLAVACALVVVTRIARIM